MKPDKRETAPLKAHYWPRGRNRDCNCDGSLSKFLFTTKPTPDFATLNKDILDYKP